MGSRVSLVGKSCCFCFHYKYQRTEAYLTIRHSSLSFAGLGFLTWYIGGKLHIGDRRGHRVRLVPTISSVFSNQLTDAIVLFGIDRLGLG